jgi:hypothetical protein
MSNKAAVSVRPSVESIMTALIELNALMDYGATLSRVSPILKGKIDVQRAKVPYQILGHHDRIRSRGRRSVSAIRNGVCAGCHLTIPIGTLNRLMLINDIAVCDNCGTFVYLVREPAAPVPSAVISAPLVRPPSKATPAPAARPLKKATAKTIAKKPVRPIRAAKPVRTRAAKKPVRKRAVLSR